MNKNKGFTLVELLAVIAILAILVLIAIPNVIGMYNNAKKGAFETEISEVCKLSKTQWMTDNFQNSSRKTYMRIDGVDYGETKIPINARDDLDYEVVVDSNGKIIRLIATDGTFQYDSGEASNINEIACDLSKNNNVQILAKLQDSEKISIDPDDLDYKTTQEKEAAKPKLTIPGTYTKINDMNRYKTMNVHGIINGSMIYYQPYWNLELITIPTGATEVLIQHAHGKNTHSLSDSSWFPSSIISGKYSCTSSNYYNCTTANCTGGFLNFNNVNTSFMSVRRNGVNLANRMVVVADGAYEPLGDLVVLKKNGNKIQIDGTYKATGYNNTGIRFKFRGPGYKDSDWYLVQINDGLIREQGCYSSESEVVVYDKKRKKKLKKKLKDLTYDDLVLVWDFDKGEYTFAKPLWIRKLEIAEEYYEVKFSDGNELDIVHDHRIFSTELNSFESILKLKPGMHTINNEGKEVEILSVKIVKVPIEFTSVITDYHMNLYVNGILTGIKLSNLYKIENMKFIKDEVVNNPKDTFVPVSDEKFKGLRLSEANFKDYYTIPAINEFLDGIEDYRK